jgi:hypothetical protein
VLVAFQRILRDRDLAANLNLFVPKVSSHRDEQTMSFAPSPARLE